MRVISLVIFITISVINAGNLKDFSVRDLADLGGKATPVLNYHDRIGIPQAKRIKQLEDELQVGHPQAILSFLLRLKADISMRIVGGYHTSIYDHPYLAGLIISIVNSSDQSVCGASLLSPNRLVTAAHCWTDGFRQAWLFEVVLGSQYLYHGGTRIPSTTVIPHPDFKCDSLKNDVAIIELLTDVQFSDQIQPIALPSEVQLSQSFAGYWATAAGYGRIHDDKRVSFDSQVSQVSLNIIPLVSCRAVFDSSYVQDSNVCTSGAGGVGICFGDSGGPLTTHDGEKNILIGVSSFVAEAGCSEGFPSVFARVTSFRSFIAQYL